MDKLNNKKVALITGITGQDGAYLTEFLLEKGYVVHGLKRRSSSFNTERIDHLYKDPHLNERNFILHYGDLTDSSNLIRILQEIEPDEIYNLGSQSHVKVSFEMPEYTANVDGLGTLRLLEAIRLLGLINKTKIYQSSTSAMYGLMDEISPLKSTVFDPRSPYAVAKMYAYWITVNYREAYNIFACNGILFNHESPQRGETFVTRKITRAVSKIALGMQEKLYLGNLSAQRDWGYAKDYVEAMWLMLQQPKADDYVISTGESSTVRDFVKLTFAEIGIEVEFCGKGEHERGIIIDKDETVLDALGIDPDQIKMGQTVVKVDSRYFRPTDSNFSVRDATISQEKLGWKPKCDLSILIAEMLRNDLQILRKDLP